MNKIPVDFVGVRVLAEKENGKRVISNSLILSTATAFLQRTGKEAEFIFIGGDPPSASLSECGAPTHSSMAALQPRDGFAGRSPSSEAGDGDRGSLRPHGVSELGAGEVWVGRVDRDWGDERYRCARSVISNQC